MGTTSPIPSGAKPIIRTGALNPLLSNRSKAEIILVTIPVTNPTTRNFIRIPSGSSGSKSKQKKKVGLRFYYVIVRSSLIFVSLQLHSQHLKQRTDFKEHLTLLQSLNKPKKHLEDPLMFRPGLWLQSPCFCLYWETWSDWPSLPAFLFFLKKKIGDFMNDLFVHIWIIRLDSNRSLTPTCFWRTGFFLFILFHRLNKKDFP